MGNGRGPAAELTMQDAIDILDSGQLMAISTVRPDGWPQTTIVGYANDGLIIYFMIFRSSQKYANIQREERVSVAIADPPRDIREAKAVFAGCRATEVIEPAEQERAWRLLEQRHPSLAGNWPPDLSAAAIMRATCQHLSILDYTRGVGHADALHFPDPPAPGTEASQTAATPSAEAPETA